MKLEVSSAPHLRAADDIRSIMLDVIISLLPSLVASVYFFGARAIAVILISVIFCVLFEFLFSLIAKRENTINDLSAVVTGMLLAFCLPASVPYWAPVAGAALAIIVVKQLFGGIGRNFLNPALTACILLIPILASKWTLPTYRLSVFAPAADTVTSATPLEYMKAGRLPDAGVLDALLGNVGGCLGETSAILLLLGGIYLLIRKVIKPTIPASFLGTVALLAFVFPRGNANFVWAAYNLCSGSVMLGAIFMATDYTTSPITVKGQLIFGIGCGLITMLIRYFGFYPEGVAFAILIMNAFVRLIDKLVRPKRFGTAKREIAIRH